MRITKICVICILGIYLLSGCGAPSTSKDVSVKSASTDSQPLIVKSKTSSIALVTDITKESVPEKPGVTRVVMTLDRKASYATSREGNRLIVNVFSAKMKSSIKQIEVRDPVIKSITAKQVGNSVKSIVELVDQDVAYRPSTSPDPFRIVVDVWQISPKTDLMQPSGEQDKVASMPVQSIEVDTSRGAQRTKEITLDVRKTPEEMPEKESSFELTSAPPTQDVPTQLQWFSEKLSQVLQERERLKQELLEVEKSFSVKDSMIQVLERKVKEANARIVELEEELIKAKSKMSLAEQNEQAMQGALDQVLARLSGEEVPPIPEGQMQGSSERILAKISTLQRESIALKDAQSEVDELTVQVASLTKERDDLQTQAETCAAEVAALKQNSSKLAAIEQELRVKEVELARLRQAIGAAAQLVTGTPGEVSVRTVQPDIQPDIQTMTSETPEESQMTTQGIEGAEQTDTQLVLAELLQQQQLTEMSPQDYVLGPEDVVQIKVLKEENLDKTVTVSSDGFITYPLLGDLRVDGLTTAQVDAQITSLLARDFLVDPEVIVEVVKARNKRVYIMGLVKQPGYHEISKDQRLLNTLLQAGGPSSFETEVRILRLPKGEAVSDEAVDTLSPVIIDLHKLFVEGDQTQNIVLHDGDVLMVAEKSAFPSATGELRAGAQQFYVVGSVVNPGVYNYKSNDTVLDAVLRAGGFTEFASRNGTKVVRETEGKTRTFRVKMKDVMEKGAMDKNIQIMPGDMIIVPESFF
jgi:polysaccharide export outer membrane protein